MSNNKKKKKIFKYLKNIKIFDQLKKEKKIYSRIKLCKITYQKKIIENRCNNSELLHGATEKSPTKSEGDENQNEGKTLEMQKTKAYIKCSHPERNEWSHITAKNKHMIEQ